MSDWQQFFVLAGIPARISNNYAASFRENRITKDMLPDLDKETLTELGVTAIGDQLAILRRVKDCGSSLCLPVSKTKNRIVGPVDEIDTDDDDTSLASTHRRGRPPPDREEIYHVKMPEGNTHRTRQILRRADLLRKNGLAVRGTTGVRQSGRSVSPLDKTSAAAVSRIYRNNHSDTVISRLGVSGLRADRMHTNVKTHVVPTRVQRHNVSSRLSSAQHSGLKISVSGAGTSGRVQKTIVTSRHAMPRVTLDMGNTRREPIGARISGIGGRLQKQQPLKSRMTGPRRGRDVRNRATIAARDQYVDDIGEEYLEGEEEVYFEDDDTMMDDEDEQVVEYVQVRGGRQKNSVYDRLSC